MPVPKESVQVRPGRGEAHFAFSDRALLDYFTSVNAILRDGSAPIIGATASLDIHWTGTRERLKISNDTAGFGGQYEHANATITWSATNDAGYSFSTVDSSEINVTHAFMAKVRNGAFFPS